MSRCTATTRSGERCQRTADGAHGFCWGHAPENASERVRAASRGGKAKANVEVRMLKEELKATIADVRSGELDRNDASIMIQGYRALQGYLELERRILETDELASEVEELKREHGRAS